MEGIMTQGPDNAGNADSAPAWGFLSKITCAQPVQAIVRPLPL